LNPRKGVDMANIKRRGNTWQIDYYLPGGERIRKLFKKKKDAEAELGKRVSLIAEGRYLDVKVETKTTFDELAEKYIENFKHQRSFRRTKKFLIEIVKERFTGRRLSEISYYDCENFLTERKDTPTRSGGVRTASTLNKEVNVLRQMLKKAVSWGLLETNPFNEGESLHLKENNTRRRYLSKEKIDALLAECPPYIEDIVEFDILTGMRRGELLCLKWSQIAGGLIYLDKTKTDEARQLPIAEDLDLVLKRIRRRQWKRGLKTDWVFCDDRGKPFREVTKAFYSALRRAGITDFKFNDLRHTFASHYLMRGGSLRGLQNRLGHKDLKMTMRYSHLSKEFAREEMKVMNGLTRPQNPTGHKMVTFEKANPAR
jgi:integrase